jgi:flagellar hook-length control protein FliK
MHKEFGELSIAIDRISDTLKVEVAAKDSEAQRALAAALANDRAAAMASDRGVQRSAEGQQNAQSHGTATQNGASHSGAGADRGSDPSGQAASNNAQSQREGQQGRERTRPDGQPLHIRNSAASDRQPTSDDGRYA